MPYTIIGVTKYPVNHRLIPFGRQRLNLERLIAPYAYPVMYGLSLL